MKVCEKVFVRQSVGQSSIKSLVDKAGAAASNIDQLANQVGVDAGDKVLEVQVDVLDCRTELCGLVVAQEARIQGV